MRRLGAAILSPLRPRFDNNDQPQSSGRQSSRLLQTPVYTSISGQAYEPNEAPEDFARDAKIELMRRATDDLKSASLDSERCQLLNDILDIMNTEPDTRDVFREMDGFLVTLNVLSSLKPPSSLQNDDIVRCIFSVLAQAVDNHRGNTATLQALIGDLVLYGTLETLVSTNATSVTHVLGCLLAFSVNDFALADLFNTIESGSDETKVLGSMNIHSVVVQNVTGIATTLRFLHLATHSTVHAALKLLDRLVHSSHRNQALLNASGIVGLLFHFLRTGPPYISESGIVSIKKSLKRLLEMGAPVEEARIIFKSFLNSVDTPTGKSYTLDPTSLDLIKNGMKFASKWPSFIAFGTGRHNRAGIDMSECQLNGRTFPGSAGFTYLAWIYIEKLPTDNSELQLLHAESTGWPPRTLCTLKVLPSGLLSYYTPSMREPTVLEPLPQQPSTPIPITVPLNVHILPPAVGTASPHPGSTSLPTRRWIQVTLVHHAIRAAHNVRVFLDGILFATATSPYPKTSPPPVSLFIGIDSPHPLAPPPPQPSASPLLGNRLNIFGGGSRPRTPVSETRQDLPPPNFSSMPTADLQDALSDKSSGPMWFLASSHLLLQSIPNELPRLFFTLGPAYTGNFQDALSKFLTYKASTSLHIGIQNQNHHHSQEGLNSLNKALSEGIELKESHIAYSISPHGIIEDGHGQQLLVNSSRERKIKEVKLGEMIGSARTIKIAPLHSAVWNFGGAAVLLRLVQLASSEQELASAVSILADAVNASWQLSDEMERSREL
ncbi:hypothetical protein FRB90_012468 [Tulasnella sp. 427]|nr:hypothetical protein FRB90_012468 [Tulasnella sp. 427]